MPDRNSFKEELGFTFYCSFERINEDARVCCLLISWGTYKQKRDGEEEEGRETERDINTCKETHMERQTETDRMTLREQDAGLRCP